MFFTNQWYNIKFSFNNILSKSKKTEITHNSEVFILGINLNESNYTATIKQELIQKLYSRTIWFTYRHGFAPLLDTNVNSDAGWGCMLRAGQMIFAQILRNHLRNSDKYKNTYQGKLLLAFADEGFNYSIKNIVTHAKQLIGINPGEWYKANYILHTLKELHELNPVEGTDQLKIVVFNDSECFLDRIYATLKNLRCDCEHIKQFLSTEEEKDSSYDFKHRICKENECQLKMSNSNGLAVFIITRIGLETVNPDYLIQLRKLMSLTQFQGIIGSSGRPQSALYIVGRADNKLIYLDPHYCQKATNSENIIEMKDTFFCDQIHYMNETDLDPSLALGFYISNEAELHSWWKKMKEINESSKPHNFIFLSETTPKCQLIEMSCSGMIIEADDDE